MAEKVKKTKGGEERPPTPQEIAQLYLDRNIRHLRDLHADATNKMLPGSALTNEVNRLGALAERASLEARRYPVGYSQMMALNEQVEGRITATGQREEGLFDRLKLAAPNSQTDLSRIPGLGTCIDPTTRQPLEGWVLGLMPVANAPASAVNRNNRGVTPDLYGLLLTPTGYVTEFHMTNGPGTANHKNTYPGTHDNIILRPYDLEAASPSFLHGEGSEALDRWNGLLGNGIQALEQVAQQLTPPPAPPATPPPASPKP